MLGTAVCPAPALALLRVGMGLWDLLQKDRTETSEMGGTAKPPFLGSEVGKETGGLPRETARFSKIKIQGYQLHLNSSA